MRTKIIIITVAIAMLAGVIYRVWDAGYDRGHYIGTQTQAAKAQFDTAFLMYWTERGSIYSEKYEDQSVYSISSDLNKLTKWFDQAMEATENDFLKGDGAMQNSINILKSEHTEVTLYLNKLIETKESHAAFE